MPSSNTVWEAARKNTRTRSQGRDRAWRNRGRDCTEEGEQEGGIWRRDGDVVELIHDNKVVNCPGMLEGVTPPEPSHELVIRARHSAEVIRAKIAGA